MSPNAPPNSVSLTSNYLEDIVPVDLHAIVEPTQDAVSTQNAANYDEGEKPLYDSYRAKQHTLGHLNTTWFLNVRFTLLALAVFSLLATGIGGGMFYHHLSDLVITVGQSGAERTATSLSRNLNQFLANHISAAKALSFAPEYEHAVANLDKESLSRANALLDWHCTAFSGAICYLMASDGTTVASSNRHSKASFVGGNYGFRPYFQQAMEGDPSIYFAEGVISKKRGIYFSAPIFSERNSQIIGVFAIKLPIKNLDALFSNTPGIIALASPGGIVFASNRSDWLYRSLQPLSDTALIR